MRPHSSVPAKNLQIPPHPFVFPPLQLTCDARNANRTFSITIHRGNLKYRTLRFAIRKRHHTQKKHYTTLSISGICRPRRLETTRITCTRR
jgi:hypothetical protein